MEEENKYRFTDEDETDNNLNEDNEIQEEKKKGHSLGRIIAIVNIVILVAIGATLGLFFAFDGSDKDDNQTTNPNNVSIVAEQDNSVLSKGESNKYEVVLKDQESGKEYSVTWSCKEEDKAYIEIQNNDVQTCTVTIIADEEKDIIVTLVATISGYGETSKEITIKGNGIHSYTWRYDYSQHWQVCNGCGETTSKQSHNVGTTYVSNGAGSHYQECQDCHYQIISVHVLDGNGDCTLCDYKKE